MTSPGNNPPAAARPEFLALCYSIAFAGAYWVFALAIAAVVLNNPVSNTSGYGIIVACLAAYVVGRAFVRRHQRVFSDPEMVWLIVWCSLWMLLFEGGAYLTGWSVITYEELVLSLPASWRPFVILLGLALNLYVLSHAFRRYVVKMMKGRIKVGS